jgi:hypothetical protein
MLPFVSGGTVLGQPVYEKDLQGHQGALCRNDSKKRKNIRRYVKSKSFYSWEKKKMNLKRLTTFSPCSLIRDTTLYIL